MEKISPKSGRACGSKATRWAWRAFVALVVTGLLSLATLAAAPPANAAGLHLKDRFGHSVRVSAPVAAKLNAKHNIKVRALATWLPRSKLAETTGTRKEYRITLVKIRCEALPIVGRVCWKTNDKLAMLSVVDYRINSQGLQQGLVTAYCLGRQRCPAWVNRPVAGSNGIFAGGGNGGGGGGGW